MLIDPELLKLIDHYFGGPDLVRPANHYLGLHVSATAPNLLTGAGAVEPTAGGYARIAIGAAFWSPATIATTGTFAGRAVKTNAAEALFAEATGAWGTPTHGLVYTALTGGTPVGIAVITAGASAIAAGTQVRFAPGKLTLAARRA